MWRELVVAVEKTNPESLDKMVLDQMLTSLNNCASYRIDSFHYIQGWMISANHVRK
jgi:hypothetical protein